MFATQPFAHGMKWEFLCLNFRKFSIFIWNRYCLVGTVVNSNGVRSTSHRPTTTGKLTTLQSDEMGTKTTNNRPNECFTFNVRFVQSFYDQIFHCLKMSVGREYIVAVNWMYFIEFLFVEEIFSLNFWYHHTQSG